jgi:hypothetical protein
VTKTTAALPLLFLLVPLLFALVYWVCILGITREYPADNEQGINDPLQWRTHFKIFGVRIAASRYKRPVGAASGAPVGITRSFWIWTKKRAWGYGTVMDWATLQNLEFKIGPMSPIVSERGDWLIRPNLVVKDGFEIRIHNRNPVDATGTIILWAFEEGTSNWEYKAIQIHFGVAKNTQQVRTCQPEKLRVLTRCECSTEPQSSTVRRARIHGRPEWLN